MKGRPMIHLLFLVIAAILLSVTPAKASDTTDWNCFGKTDVCVGPSVSVSMIGYNLVTHSVSIGAMPVGAAGVEVSAYSSQWYRLGLSLNLAAVAQQTGSNSLSFAPVFSFAKYARVGAIMQTVGDSAQWTIIGGIGITQ